MSCGKGRRWALAACALVLMCAAPGLAGAAGSPSVNSQGETSQSVTKRATFTAQDASIQRLTAAVQMTKDDKGPARAFAGPTHMLANPANPRVIVAATANLRTRMCYLIRSTDAGRTWQILDEDPPGLESYPYCTTGHAGVAQSTIAWGSDQTLYYALAGYGPGEGGDNEHVSILLARSTDLGDTWTTTVVENNRGVGPAPSASGVTGLAVDTSGPRDVVYVGYIREHPSAPEDSPLQDDEIVVAVSADGGATFERSVNLNEFSDVTQTIAGQSYPLIMESSFGEPFLVAHDGVVLAVAGGQTPYNVELPGESYHPHPQLVARSTDQGRTWSVKRLGPPIFTATGTQTGMGWTPDGGPHGTFLATYAATPATAATSGWANVVLQRSTDRGKTWSDPVVLNDGDPSKRFTSFYPQLNVAPNGRVDVVWQDNRRQHDYHFQVRYTYSTDGGATWAPNVKVTDQPIDFGFGVSYNSDIRQPPGVASADEYAAIGWADTRKATETTQTQDNYAVLAQFAPIPPAGSTVLPILAAVFGGLAAAGIVLVLVLQIRRRRERPTPQ